MYILKYVRWKKILKTRQKPATDVLIGVVRIDVVSFL